MSPLSALSARRLESDASLPSWLPNVTGQHRPHYVVTDPTKSVVWEVIGTEFTKNSAGQGSTSGVSIRFPRLVRERDDKGIADANALSDLKALLALSRKPASGAACSSSSAAPMDGHSASSPPQAAVHAPHPAAKLPAFLSPLFGDAPAAVSGDASAMDGSAAGGDSGGVQELDDTQSEAEDQQD